MYSFIVYCSFTYFVSHAKTQEQDEVKSYDGAQVWRTNLRGGKDLSSIIKLVEDRDISLWNLDTNRAEFLVQMQDKVKVNRILKTQKLNHSVLIMDVQRRVDNTKVEPRQWNEETLRIGHRLNWNEYPTLGVIHEYYAYLTENFPSICNVTTIGFTSENISIKMVKISNGNPNNKALLITSGMHAREWVAITSALYVLEKVVSKFDHLPNYMKTIDWIFIPLLNPDGFEYSHSHDRLWRKNRRKLQSCNGVDINRNFDIDWDVAGFTDKNECYESYAGPHAFSEAESKALRDVILKTKKKPLAMLDIHSYGRLILYPWSARSNPTPDRRLLWSSAKIMTESIYNNTGKNYRFGATYHMVYPATGAAIDWMYFTGVLLTFGLELGEEGGHGFLMPSDNIETTGKDLLFAVKELLKNLDPELIKMRAMNGHWF